VIGILPWVAKRCYCCVVKGHGSLGRLFGFDLDSVNVYVHSRERLSRLQARWRWSLRGVPAARDEYSMNLITGHTPVELRRLR
jgi:hypothetical protein